MSRFKLPQRLTSRRPRSSRRVESQGTQPTDRRDFEMQEADRLEAERDRHDPEAQAVPAREFAEVADAEPARGRPGRALSAIVGLLLVVALLWIAGELHYQSCIQAAQARTPAP